MQPYEFVFPKGVPDRQLVIPKEICEQITDVVIPDGAGLIPDFAFKNCIALRSVVLPDGLTSIGYGAFSNCKSLEKLVFPESLEHIDGSVFGNCESLKEIVIPKNVRTIGFNAFAYCKSLTSVVLEGKRTKLGVTINHADDPDERTVFHGCSNLTSFSLPTDHLYYTMKNGLLLSKNSAEVLACMCRYETIEIPDGVEIIAQCAFAGNDVLRRVVFPDTLKMIDFAAFFECSALENVVIPSSVKEVGEEAFCGCHSLASVTILGNPGVGTGAFGECEALASIESKFELDEDAFWPHWNGC